MTCEAIQGKNGYNIPVRHTLTGTERTVVLISHGFGSSKESPTVQMLAAALPPLGLGTLAFDFPAHGDSPVDGDMLSVGHCLDDLSAAEARARALCPGAEIVYFASSFGAYLNLIYLATRPHAGDKAFLRSAAVEMPLLFRQRTPEEQAPLAARGYEMLDLGYARPIKVTQAFVDDLDAHDVFRLYRAGAARVAMVHGDRDETAPVEAAVRFADRFGAALTIIPGGDHRLSIPGAPERVLALAAAFFTGP